MVDVVPSILQLRVRFSGEQHDTALAEETGSILNLSIRFQFRVVNDSHWDLSMLAGRKCEITKTSDGYRFVKFRDHLQQNDNA
jgi:hypothetical protein